MHFGVDPPTVDTTGEVPEITETEGVAGVGSIGCPLDENAACEATCPIRTVSFHNFKSKFQIERLKS